MPTSEPVKIVFGVLSKYEREGWIHPSILQFFCELPFLTGFAHRMVPIHAFIPAASGRNVFCKQLRDSEADWLCMIDNDMALPLDLLKVLEGAPADADIIVPRFYMWDQSKLDLKLCWGIGELATTGEVDGLRPGFHELTKCGTGVIFIRPRVLKGLDYPYFVYQFNPDGGLAATEDIPFILRAREKGFKVYGNTEVEVGHYHSVELGSMWEWYEKILDRNKQAALDSRQKDSGRSPDRSAEACSVEAT